MQLLLLFPSLLLLLALPEEICISMVADSSEHADIAPLAVPWPAEEVEEFGVNVPPLLMLPGGEWETNLESFGKSVEESALPCF